MVKKVGNLIPNTFFITKGSGESDLEKHAGSYHMALYDAGISDFNIMTYSSVIPATAHLATMDELDLPPFGSEMKTIMAVSHGYQDEFVSAGVVYAWMYKDENFDEKVGGLVCEVSGRYRIEELESRLSVLSTIFIRRRMGSIILESLTLSPRESRSRNAMERRWPPFASWISFNRRSRNKSC